MKKAKAVCVNGNWGIEFDSEGNRATEERFMKACRTYLRKRMFPTAQWCLGGPDKEGNVLRVICHGPSAKRDARDAAVILSAATHMDIKKGA
jgi:hypothetical protein